MVVILPAIISHLFELWKLKKLVFIQVHFPLSGNDAKDNEI